MKVQFKVWRGDAKTGVFRDYATECTEGMVVLDAVARLVPGVLDDQSTVEESHSDSLLEYPHYTRPAAWTGPDGVERCVPDVLLSGHHARIAAWRRAMREEVTRQRRPDLWARRCGTTDRG